jgi:hypothetical protein
VAAIDKPSLLLQYRFWTECFTNKQLLGKLFLSKFVLFSLLWITDDSEHNVGFQFFGGYTVAVVKSSIPANPGVSSFDFGMNIFAEKNCHFVP